MTRRKREVFVTVMLPCSVRLVMSTDTETEDLSDLSAWEVDSWEVDRPPTSWRQIEELVFDNPEILGELTAGLLAAEDLRS